MDLRGISAEEGFRVDEILHASFVDVDEAGTEAAAATVVEEIGAWGRTGLTVSGTANNNADTEPWAAVSGYSDLSRCR